MAVPAQALLVGLPLLKLVLHVALGDRYGYQGDELYFIACGRHPAFGYVDHAPFVPWVAGMLEVAGLDSLRWLRLPGAIAGALTLLLTMHIAARLGGGPWARGLAGLAILVAPVYLRAGSILSLPTFEPLFWTLASYGVLRALQDGDGRWWLLTGVAAGIGLLNKHTMLLWGMGLAVGLIFSEHRSWLRRPWPWGAAAIALVMLLPNILWQSAHAWPTLEFVGHIDTGMLALVPRHLFLAGQILYMHPLSLPIWATGLVFLLRPSGRRYRLFAWIYLVALLVLFVRHGKPYYLAPAYPVLLAFGGCALETGLVGRRFRLVRRAYLALIVGSGIALGLLSLPALPLAQADGVVNRLFGWAVQPGDLTGEFHEQFGWPELADRVAAVYHELPDEERMRSAVLTRTYAQAAAIDFFGPALGLPGAISGHMTYYLWGPGSATGDVTIAVGYQPEALQPYYGQVEIVARAGHPLAARDARDMPIAVCRRPAVPLQQMWPAFRRFYHVERSGVSSNTISALIDRGSPSSTPTGSVRPVME